MSIEDGKILHLRLDNDVLDSSGQDNHGTSYGAPLSYGSGVLGSSVYFNGEDQYIESTTSLPVSSTTWTVSFWFNAFDNIGLDYLFMCGRGDTGFGMSIDNQLGYGLTPFGYSTYGGIANISCVYGGIGYFDTGATVLNMNRWYHAVLRRLDNSTEMFIDGEKLDWVLNTEPITPINGWILGGNPDNSSFFHGGVDDVIIWDRGLSDEEIKTLHESYVFLKYYLLNTKLFDTSFVKKDINEKFTFGLDGTKYINTIPCLVDNRGYVKLEHSQTRSDESEFIRTVVGVRRVEDMPSFIRNQRQYRINLDTKSFIDDLHIANIIEDSGQLFVEDFHIKEINEDVILFDVEVNSHVLVDDTEQNFVENRHIGYVDTDVTGFAQDIHVSEVNSDVISGVDFVNIVELSDISMYGQSISTDITGTDTSYIETTIYCNNITMTGYNVVDEDFEDHLKKVEQYQTLDRDFEDHLKIALSYTTIDSDFEDHLKKVEQYQTLEWIFNDIKASISYDLLDFDLNNLKKAEQYQTLDRDFEDHLKKAEQYETIDEDLDNLKKAEQYETFDMLLTDLKPMEVSSFVPQAYDNIVYIETPTFVPETHDNIVYINTLTFTDTKNNGYKDIEIPTFVPNDFRIIVIETNEFTHNIDTHIKYVEDKKYGQCILSTNIVNLGEDNWLKYTRPNILNPKYPEWKKLDNWGHYYVDTEFIPYINIHRKLSYDTTRRLNTSRRVLVILPPWRRRNI